MTDTTDARDQQKGPEFLGDTWIAEVLTTRDTPLRTHRITLTYNKFAECLDALIFQETSPATSNANWFHFATWGTYTLGPNIRNDSAPQRLDSLPSALRRWITPTIVHSRSADGDLVGRALSWGQQLIFLSAARALVSFEKLDPSQPGHTFQTSAADKEQLLKTVNNAGTIWIDKGHLELIDKAFSCYSLARRHVLTLSGNKEDPSTDPIICRLLLLGTILLTLVEQDLVTSALQTVTDAVPVRLTGQFDGHLASFIAKRRAVPRQVVALNVLNQISQTSTWLTEAWARFMTSQLLVIVLPAETLRLGKDIPPRDYTAPLYPRPLDDLAFDEDALKGKLDQLSHRLDRDLARAYLVELDEIVRTLNRSADDGLGSGARDWRRFDDRLNWAICLFRSRQKDPSLLWRPYSQEDEDRIVDGELPHGRSLGGVVPPLDSTAINAFLRVEAKMQEPSL